MPYLFFILFFLYSTSICALDANLANTHYHNRAYEKALDTYKQLLNKQKTNTFYYQRLLQCYVKLHKFDIAESLVKKYIKKNKSNPEYLIDLGFVLSNKGDLKQAENLYQSALNKLPKNVEEINAIIQKYRTYEATPFVENTYKKAIHQYGYKKEYALSMALLCIQKQRIKMAITYLLQHLAFFPQGLQQVKNILQPYVLEDISISETLEESLYGQIQAHKKEVHYLDLLIWLFIQKKDFASALIQVKALDKRDPSYTEKVLQLARLAQTNKVYSIAISAYAYLKKKGMYNPFYLPASKEWLLCKKEQLKEQGFSQTEAKQLKEQYLDFAYKQNIPSNDNAQTILDLAEIEALYLYQLDSAIHRLRTFIERNPSTLPNTLSKIKLQLGDYYVSNQEEWEASLLFTQVDKKEKDSPLGELARFKNAQLFYFKSQFELAQSQLDILKTSTSEFIANDALKLSVFIIDNIGLDSNTTPLSQYASAELLYRQNKIHSAIDTLQQLLLFFPDHPIRDDVYFFIAQIHVKQKNYDHAILFFNHIIEKHQNDILVDDALYHLADIYENQMQAPLKAFELYKKIITQHKDSIWSVDARKRIRRIRGDDKTN